MNDLDSRLKQEYSSLGSNLAVIQIKINHRIQKLNLLNKSLNIYNISINFFSASVLYHLNFPASLGHTLKKK